MNKYKAYKIAAIVCGSLLLTGLTGAAYFYNNKMTIVSDNSNKSLTGKPLAAFEAIYPIIVDSNGRLALSKERFVASIHELKLNPSEQAIADLIYLGQQNNITVILSPEEKGEYQSLAAKLPSEDLERIINKRDAVFRTYRDIVNGIGETFTGTGIEIVLHDTRNPIKSIVAVQNPISGRQLGDPNTNFGVELIKDYSAVNLRGSSYISYPLTLKDGRAIKSTTIPLFDDRYGLIGFICMNIDISKIKTMDPNAVKAFVQAIAQTEDQAKIDELIVHAKQASQPQPKE